MTHQYTSPAISNANLLGPSLAEYCSASAYVVFASLLNELLRSRRIISGIDERVRTNDLRDEYDFVVIGGGAAGCAAAARLSEIPSWNVLLLEAGPDEPAMGQVPQLVETLHWTSLDWNFTTSNESHACLSTNGSCKMSAGRMLGGSTSSNGMIYHRGNPSDFERWVALGNPGWTWDEVLEFYKKSEDNFEIDRVGRKHHATGGPLSVGRFPFIHPFAESIMDAAVEAGFDISEDFNGDNITGFSIMQSTNKRGVRHSSAAAYLRPIRSRPNLDVSLNSEVTRIIVRNGTVEGVEYHKNGELKTVRVKGEVVVSAGNILSPKLLLLSGIGSAEYLNSVGINVVKDLPGVGENYQDHVSYAIQYTINDNDTYEYDWAVAGEYLAYQTGPMSGTGADSVIGYLASNGTGPESPDIEVYFGSYVPQCAPGDINALRTQGKRTVVLHAVNIRPKSRGRISLASNNPLDYPVIWGNYLQDPSDVDLLVDGIEMALKLTETDAMKAHDLTMTYKPLEACSDHAFPSKAYWACAVRQDATSELHHGGSCKMGPASDPMSVVDSKLRVHGIRGLRVADTSIMPVVTSGNTQAPAIMIGERVADFIKKDWDSSDREL